jgi:hypothetical protein
LSVSEEELSARQGAEFASSAIAEAQPNTLARCILR